MRKTILVVLFIVLSVGAFSQAEGMMGEDRPNLIISANVLGDASIISITADRLFFLKPSVTLSTKLGIGYNSAMNLLSSGQTESYYTLPHHVTWNFGRNKSFFELGFGGALITGNENARYLAYPIIGYRSHPYTNPGFSFRLWLYYPFFQNFDMDWDIWIGPGFSFGLAFK